MILGLSCFIYKMGTVLHHLPEDKVRQTVWFLEVPSRTENCSFMVVLGWMTKGVFLEEEGLVPGLKLW